MSTPCSGCDEAATVTVLRRDGDARAKACDVNTGQHAVNFLHNRLCKAGMLIIARKLESAAEYA